MGVVQESRMSHPLISKGQSEHSRVYDEFLFYFASIFLKHSMATWMAGDAQTNH